MTLEISTPTLLFPAISLLFLAYTNRFLHLSALIRQLYTSWQEIHDDSLRAQIDSLRRRLALIRWMQLLGAGSLFLCVTAMISIFFGSQSIALTTFIVGLTMMAASLFCLLMEIFQSGDALNILLDRIDCE